MSSYPPAILPVSQLARMVKAPGKRQGPAGLARHMVEDSWRLMVGFMAVHKLVKDGLMGGFVVVNGLINDG